MPATADGDYDVVVVGTGAGGIIGAYAAASRGLRTLAIEKTEYVGGTTAYSGAGIWYPGSAPIVREGFNREQRFNRARTYLGNVVNDASLKELQEAYLRSGIEVIDYLEQNPRFGQFLYRAGIPEYFHEELGFEPLGNTIFPQPLLIADAPEAAAFVRPNLPTEHWGAPVSDVLTGGRALIGRALDAFFATGNGTLLLETALTGLLTEGGRVVGVRVKRAGESTEIRATQGVLIAAGGFERSAALRKKYQAEFLDGSDSNGAPGNTGDGILAGAAIGAALDNLDQAWFVPAVVRPNGKPVFHTGTLGGIWVNGAGERFTNETQPYDRAGHAMYEGWKASGISHSPTYWIVDERQAVRDNFGGIPGEPIDPAWLESGALKRFTSVDDLAAYIGVSTERIQNTLDEFNRIDGGPDTKFGRGESPWDKFSTRAVGYPAETSQPVQITDKDVENPLTLPVEGPPYYVYEVRLGDIGTKGGLVTDVDARVLREDGSAIEGLYATGNSMSAMSGKTYPGAGTPIGSSIAFAHRAITHLAQGRESETASADGAAVSGR